MATMRGAFPGETISYRSDGATLVYDVTENGVDMGHIVMPNGVVAERRPLLSLLVRGGWKAEPVAVAKHGSHDQSSHGNWAGGGSTGGAREVAASDSRSAWEAVLTDEARALDDRKAAHPDRYNPPGRPDFGLKDGATEVRVVTGDGPPRVRDYETSTSAGMTMSEATQVEGFLGLGVSGYGRPLVPVGEARPPQHVYRVMSVAEFDQAQSRGYIKSDERMNLASGEGTVTSLRSTGSFYAPVDGSDYRVVRIKYDDADGWRTDSDGYIKTDERVPFDRVDVYSSPISNPSVAKHGSHDQSSHGNWASGRSSAVPAGWSQTSREDLAQRIQAQWEGWGYDTEHARERAAELAAKTQEYKGPNGTTVTVDFSATGGEPNPAKVAESLQIVSDLQAQNPVAGLEVKFSHKPFRDEAAFVDQSAHGFVMRGEKTMNMQPYLLKGDGDGPKSDAGHFMPSYSETSNLRYYMTHEYGHIRDTRNRGNVREDAYRFDGLETSRYGSTNEYEKYAESYTEWSLTGGKTTNATVQAYAQKYFWGDNMSKATSDDEVERVIIVDTFSEDKPPYVATAVGKSVSVAFAPGLRPVLKHGSHDQSSHGNWARGGSVAGQFTDPGGGTFEDRNAANDDTPSRRTTVSWNMDNEIASDEDAIARALMHGDYSGLDIGTSRLAQRLGAASARIQSRIESIATQLGIRKPVKTWTVSSEQADRMRDSYYEKYGKPSWMEKMRRLFKHAQHDQSSHGNWAGGGKSGSPWGDRQAEIDAMSGLGPSARAIKNAVTPIDDDVLRERIAEDYGEMIRDDAETAVTEAMQAEGWVDHSDDPDYEPPTVGRTYQEEFDARVESEMEFYVDIYVDNYGFEYRQQAAQGDGQLDTDTFNEVFGMSHTGYRENGTEVTLQTNVDYVEVVPSSWNQEMTVYGTVYDLDGNEKGEFQRKFFVDDSGDLVVEHALLDISDDVQGVGFSKAFNRQAENYYISHGIEKVNVHAALGVGGYAWAKQGFDWAPRGGATGSVKSRLSRMLDDPMLPRSLRESGQSIADRFRLPPYDVDYPTPRELASWGYVRGAPTWPGKMVMLGSSWYGQKSLSPDGPRQSKTEADLAANPPSSEIPGQLKIPGVVA